MEREDIKRRIDEVTTLINRDAGYTVPHIRVSAEQTLALWAVAEQITEANATLFEIARAVTQLELTLRGGFTQLTKPPKGD